MLELDTAASLELVSTALELDTATESEFAAEDSTELELAVESVTLELLDWGGTTSSVLSSKFSAYSPFLA